MSKLLFFLVLIFWFISCGGEKADKIDFSNYNCGKNSSKSSECKQISSSNGGTSTTPSCKEIAEKLASCGSQDSSLEKKCGSESSQTRECVWNYVKNCNSEYTTCFGQSSTGNTGTTGTGSATTTAGNSNESCGTESNIENMDCDAIAKTISSCNCFTLRNSFNGQCESFSNGERSCKYKKIKDCDAIAYNACQP